MRRTYLLRRYGSSLEDLERFFTSSVVGARFVGGIGKSAHPRSAQLMKRCSYSICTSITITEAAPFAVSFATLAIPRSGSLRKTCRAF
jgi:hypothetical protein